MPSAQALLRRLAVFAGGCTRDAAVAICGADRGDLTALVRASLLRLTDPGTGHERFSMLATIRSFAGDLLEQSDENEAVRRRHAEYEQCRALAQKLGLDLELGAALANLGDVALMQGDTAQARAHYSESLALCRAADDAEGIAIAVQSLGIASLRDDLPAEAATHFAAALDLFSRLQFTERMGACLTGLAAGVVAHDPGEAARLLGAARALRERTSTPAEWWWEDAVLTATSDAARAVLGDAAFAVEFERGRAAPDVTVVEAAGVQRK